MLMRFETMFFDLKLNIQRNAKRPILNCSVAQAYVNQKKLDTETKILHANVTHFAKQTTQWLKLVEDFNQALKVSQSSATVSVMLTLILLMHAFMSLLAIYSFVIHAHTPI